MYVRFNLKCSNNPNNMNGTKKCLGKRAYDIEKNILYSLVY